jgi:isoaspartyl peptidase/L-asparaginase-like protein (Ntn-hydrolase superfamily)
VIVVHGGCGNPSGGTVEHEEDYHRGLEEAVLAASAALTAGAGALGAAQAAVSRLEDAPMFNAGRGSVLTSEGRVEMDAAIVCGLRSRAGACAAVSTVRHPVALARSIMEATDDVLVVGPGADRLAGELELELMDPAWFVTERQRERLRRSQEGVAHEDPGDTPIGTVGAVVLDSDGALAAATSTGGRRGQRPGRVGDSPIVGAGAFADRHVAVSATGNGEEMIRGCRAHEVSALMRHAGLDLAAACSAVMDGVEEIGLIAVDASGNFAMPFDTTLMHRGWRVGAGPVETRVFG